MTVVRVRSGRGAGFNILSLSAGATVPIPLSTVCGMASQISTTERRLTVLRSRSV